MKVKDLLSILRDLDPEANVVLCAQPNYPIEYTLRDVAVRSDFSDPDDMTSGAQPNDVLLLEGTHLRYGSRAAWDASRAQR
jgi:hypothetical protein